MVCTSFAHNSIITAAHRHTNRTEIGVKPATATNREKIKSHVFVVVESRELCPTFGAESFAAAAAVDGCSAAPTAHCSRCCAIRFSFCNYNPRHTEQNEKKRQRRCRQAMKRSGLCVCAPFLLFFSLFGCRCCCSPSSSVPLSNQFLRSLDENRMRRAKC